MFARPGYVPLARLWPMFEARYLSLCKERALRCLEVNLHSKDIEFGTALDLCEDVFLQTFDACDLELLPVAGDVVTVQPRLAQSDARLLSKATAFEALHICVNDSEAGPDGRFVRQLGSAIFEIADMEWLYPGNGGRVSGERAKAILFANAFNTLPILFERSTYVITKERPPWSRDLIDCLTSALMGPNKVIC